MLTTLRRGFSRPLITMWLTFSSHSWKRHVVAHDSPHIHVPGTNPDRVLVTGDGAASGRGVRTHELGLPGFLARSLSARTRRATDVDVVVDDDMTVDSCRVALTNRNLYQYDVIVVSIGANEALSLMPTLQWQAATRAFLNDVLDRTAAATRVFVLAIPEFGINPHFPAVLATSVDYHVGMMNTITEHLTADLENVVFVPEGKGLAFELEGVALYQQWADTIAARISRTLDPQRPHAADSSDADERQRQLALENLEARHPGADATLDGLTDQTRALFATEMAAITFVRSDTQLFRTASGFDAVVLPRSESFCDVTVRRDAVLVIEDAGRDGRYADYSVVAGEPGIRFYAGYPIEAPNGQRVGALCVMDTKPRHFSDDDAAALKALAHRVQAHLYDGD